MGAKRKNKPEKWGINLEPVRCPQCGALQPKGFRFTKVFNHFFWGYMTCENCGCEMDKWGTDISIIEEDK